MNKSQHFNILNLRFYGKSAASVHTGTWDEITLIEYSTIFHTLYSPGESPQIRISFKKDQIAK